MTQNALAKVGELVLPPGVDTTGMSPEDIQALAEFYAQELNLTKQGVELRPSRYKINKDSCKFVDPFGEQVDELVGVIVFKHTARGYWPRESESSAPACSSMDGKTGQLSEEGKELLRIPDGQACASCPFNQWGSGVDELGNPTRGKACKEMRRIFLMTEGAQMPAMLTLPPTSITDFDQYISARVQQGIADIAAETKIDLVPESGGKFNYAKARFKKGKPVQPQRMLQLAKMRADIQSAAEKAGIDLHDDYGVDNGAAEGDPF